MIEQTPSFPLSAMDLMICDWLPPISSFSQKWPECSVIGHHQFSPLPAMVQKLFDWSLFIISFSQPWSECLVNGHYPFFSFGGINLK